MEDGGLMLLISSKTEMRVFECGACHVTLS